MPSSASTGVAPPSPSSELGPLLDGPHCESRAAGGLAGARLLSCSEAEVVPLDVSPLRAAGSLPQQGGPGAVFNDQVVPTPESWAGVGR